MSTLVDRLVLASASPRRRELLHQVGIPHIVCPTHIPEVQYPAETPNAFVKRLAYEKASAAEQQMVSTPNAGSRYWFLGADTVVVLRDRVLGKPQDIHQAREYLSLLQGTDHTVITGFALLCPALGLAETDIESTPVSFEPLGESEIELYLSFSDWADAAGAYKIQGSAAAFVRSVHGSFPNVMGLPIHRICSILRANHFRIGNWS